MRILKGLLLFIFFWVFLGGFYLMSLFIQSPDGLGFLTLIYFFVCLFTAVILEDEIEKMLENKKQNNDSNKT